MKPWIIIGNQVKKVVVVIPSNTKTGSANKKQINWLEKNSSSYQVRCGFTLLAIKKKKVLEEIQKLVTWQQLFSLKLSMTFR